MSPEHSVNDATPCKAEQWLISVQHDSDDIERFNGKVARFAAGIADVSKMLDSAR
jgi:hypothetical protein